MAHERVALARPIPARILRAPVSRPDDPDDVLGENGGLLPGPHATLAGPTFAEWLEQN